METNFVAELHGHLPLGWEEHAIAALKGIPELTVQKHMMGLSFGFFEAPEGEDGGSAYHAVSICTSGSELIGVGRGGRAWAGVSSSKHAPALVSHLQALCESLAPFGAVLSLTFPVDGCGCPQLNPNTLNSEDRQEQIQKDLLALGLRMDPSLSAFDGSGHALMRISDEECVDPMDYPSEVLALAEEWSMLEGPNDDDQIVSETCR